MILQRTRLDFCSRERWAVLCLFVDVTNGSEIKQALVEQHILNATFLNASSVSTLPSNQLIFSITQLVSPFHVMCAVNKACLEEERGTMKAKTLNMQIIHCLGSTSNVSVVQW